MKNEKLKKHIELLSGSAFKSKYFNQDGDGLPLIRVRDVNSGFAGIYYNGSYDEKYIINNGDLLIGMDGDFKSVCWQHGKALLNQRVVKIKAKKSLEIDYLQHFLPEALNEIHRKTTFTTVKHLSNKKINNIKIPLPSLDNQKRIAQVLSNCESLIQKRKESIALLDELLKSTFLEMFGDPRTNSKKWEMKAVINYADCIVPGRDKPKDFTGQTLWITTNDLEHLSYTSKSKTNKGLSNIEIEQVRAKIIPKNSVLMTCVGDLGVVSIAEENMVVNQQLHTFQCKGEINNIFLMFNLSFQTHYMYKMASTTTLPYLNKTNCNSIPVIKPPIGLQNKFAAIVEKVETIKLSYQTHLRELENLYGSISQKAFKGELDLSEVNISSSSNAVPTTSGNLDSVINIKTPVAGSLEPPKEEEKSPKFSKKELEGLKTKLKVKRDITNMTILDYYGVPKDLQYTREKAEFEIADWDIHCQFLLKDNFRDKNFTANDIYMELHNYFYYKGDMDFDHEAWKEIIFKFLEVNPPLLEQFFDKKDNTVKLKLTDEAFKA